MTNGKKVYDINGNTVYKEFCDKDWTAIKRFRALGVNVVFLSGDNFNEGIAKNRNIPFWHNILPKETYLDKICKAFNVAPFHSVAYVGDDLFDVEIAKQVRYPFCPLDAIKEMKDVCATLWANGGDNVIMYLYDYLSASGCIPKWNDSHLKELYELDNKEYKAP